MRQPDIVSTAQVQVNTPSDSSAIWRIAAGLIPMPLAVLLDNIFSADASERLPLIFIFHLLLGPYSLMWAIVAAFMNEHVVNPYIKYSAIAIPVGSLMIGSVAAVTSATPYAWATAFVITTFSRVHYHYTTHRKRLSVR